MSEIIINKPNLKDNTLISKITVSNNLKRFLKTNELFIKYNKDIQADQSILSIPLTASILPLAWLTRSNVYIQSIDRRFKESMDLLKNEFKDMYPRISFDTEIIAQELVENEPLDDDDHIGLMFSGGVDSTYTLFSHLDLKPSLIMLWGIDDFPYPEHREHWEKAISIYHEFAERKGLEFHVIKTNICELLDYRRIEHKYHKELYNGDLRDALQHSLVLLPTTAPLSVGRFNHLLIAASFIPEINFSRYPRAALPNLDEKIKWADLNVKHHGLIDRTEKIISLANSINQQHLTLRVCLRSTLKDGKLNDSVCEKCLRTIVLLVLARIDPNDCGFKLDASTWSSMRSYWENKESITPNFTWRKIQNMIPKKIEEDIYGSKAFFEWFKEFEIEITPKDWSYTELYMGLPYPLAKLLDKVYYKLGINVHESPYNREYIDPVRDTKTR